MTQPKNILFGTGAPKMLVVANPAPGVYLAPDGWNQVLDLRTDPERDVVRRLTLWAYRNVVSTSIIPLTAATVCVIDDTITTGVQAVTERLAAYATLPLDGVPVKIMDDYPIRGAVRVIAGTDVQVANPLAPDNVVLFGFYTIAGEAGSRAMCDPRPFQIGNAVPVNAALPTAVSNALPNVHETTDEYVDELTFRVSVAVSSESAESLTLYFGDPADLRYLYFKAPFFTADLQPNIMEGVPLRGVGLITGNQPDAGDVSSVIGHFIRY